MIQKILMADDDINVWYTCLKNCFETLGLLDKIDTAKTPEGALSKIQATEYDVVLLDISFSAGNKEGIGLISEICKLSPGTDIVMMTTYASEETIAECMQRGASDFISKDDLTDEEAIRACLDAALERSSKKKSNQNLGKTLAEKVGATFVSKSMQNFYSEICHVRKESKMHVLVTGESGTGKELVAKAIARDDQDAPFISVNSSCFGKELLEGELFGHEKGSFTGADKQKLGLFELANGGDIFFDEIATLPLDHQSKLLRVLQSGEFFRIGGTKVLKTTARVIAATNEDLDDMVLKGRFREDLLQRLKRYQIHIHPLRDRKEDIPVIVDAVVKRSGKPGVRIHPRVMGILESFSWPTNVRQLEDTLIRAIMMSNGETLTVGDLPGYLFKSKAPKAECKSDLSHSEVETDLNFEDAVERFSSVYLRTVISQLPRPITLETLGEAVGMSKSALHRRLEKYEIDLTPAKSPAEGAAKETVQ